MAHIFSKLFGHQAPEQRRDTMRAFVQDHGGRIRFDKFSEEHLLGAQRGFYSRAIDLSRDHSPVPTPMSEVPEYRRAYARYVLREASALCTRMGLTQITIAELGPGGGELCRQLREELQQRPKALAPLVDFQYIGIDPNRQHATSLHRQGEHAVIGVAQNLPLQTSSVDMVIAEEVLDALPYRVCKWKRKTSRIEQEAFVEDTSKGLRLRFDSPERDDTINTVEGFLREYHYRNCQYSFSPGYADFWREVLRVLRPHGMAIVSDYTITAWIGRYTKHTMEQHAVARPYADDLTHLVDGLLQVDVAKSAGFSAVEEIRARKEFAELGGPKAGEAIARGARMVLRALKDAV